MEAQQVSATTRPKASASGLPHYVTRPVEEADPFRFFARHAAGPRFLSWGGGEGYAAVGVAAVAEASGPERFQQVRDQAYAIQSRILHERTGGVPAEVGPRWFGALTFEDRGDSGRAGARFTLPRAQLTVLNGYAYETILLEKTKEVGPTPEAWPMAEGASSPWQTRPDPAGWTTQLRNALQAIRSGAVEKVVVARHLSRTLPRSPNLLRILESLAHRAPTSRLVLVEEGPDDAWVAATPELLVTTRGHRLETVAVAGSRARGRTPEEDAALGRALLASSKDGWEHELVCRHVRAVLERRQTNWRMPVERALLKLPHVQHLETRFEADIGPQDHVLDFAQDLHPTPAVAGYPTQAARPLVRELEGQPRGLYAGGVGCFDASGDGQIHVLLRCAHVEGRHVTLFAGCGIVNGSEPAEEWEESRTKFQLLLDAFDAEAP